MKERKGEGGDGKMMITEKKRLRGVIDQKGYLSMRFDTYYK